MEDKFYKLTVAFAVGVIMLWTAAIILSIVAKIFY